jgi:hypothetical protein
VDVVSDLGLLRDGLANFDRDCRKALADLPHPRARVESPQAACHGFVQQLGEDLDGMLHAVAILAGGSAVVSDTRGRGSMSRLLFAGKTSRSCSVRMVAAQATRVVPALPSRLTCSQAFRRCWYLLVRNAERPSKSPTIPILNTCLGNPKMRPESYQAPGRKQTHRDARTPHR